MEIIFYSFIFFLSVIWCRYKWNRRHIEKFAAKLKGPPAYPFIGNCLLFFGAPERIYNNVLQLDMQYRPGPIKFWMGPFFMIILDKPEDIQVVLNNSSALEKPLFYNFVKVVFGEGLITAPVNKWKKHRRIINPVFNSIHLKQFFPVFNEKNILLINNLKKELGKEQHFDLWDYISPTILDLICQTAMGHNLDTLSNKTSEFSESLQKLLELTTMRVYKPWLYLEFVNVLYEKITGLNKYYQRLQILPNQVIKEKRESHDKNKLENNENSINDTCNNTFLDKLLDLEKSGIRFTDKELRDEVITIMSAGSETSSITVSLCLLLLAMHPDIQDKVYNEIYYTLGDGDETITMEDTTKLVYMEQVLKETLRLYPIVPMILRELQDDVKIVTDNITIPKGTICNIAVISTHHCPEWYPNPFAFNPDNFKTENVAKRHKYSFIPFSGGIRDCIGSKYAMLSMKVLIAMVLRNYRLYTDYKLSDIKMKIDMTIKSVEGYPVKISPRVRQPTSEMY